MANKYIFSKYALIGDTLDLKQNVNLEIDQSGKIIEISFPLSSLSSFSGSFIRFMFL